MGGGVYPFPAAQGALLLRLPGFRLALRAEALEVLFALVVAVAAYSPGRARSGLFFWGTIL